MDSRPNFFGEVADSAASVRAGVLFAPSPGETFSCERLPAERLLGTPGGEGGGMEDFGLLESNFDMRRVYAGSGKCLFSPCRFPYRGQIPFLAPDLTESP